jgi:hypothetical protein
MTTFDLSETRKFTADLESRMDSCDNGEGLECAGLDNTLRNYAKVCCEFREAVRRWGREVFSGRTAFDPVVEELLLDEGVKLYSRALEMSGYGEHAELPCYTLDGQAELQSALGSLYQLLRGWVTPKLAVGPSARQGTGEVPESVRARIRDLPPLPHDWQPADPRQRSRYRKLR